MEVVDFLDALLKMKGELSDVDHKAEKVIAQINQHEAVCAERYGNIRRDMTVMSEHMNLSFPVLTSELGKIKSLVYIGIGIWTGAPVVGGFCYLIWQVVKGNAHGG